MSIELKNQPVDLYFVEGNKEARLLVKNFQLKDYERWVCHQIKEYPDHIFFLVSSTTDVFLSDEIVYNKIAPQIGESDRKDWNPFQGANPETCLHRVLDIRGLPESGVICVSCYSHIDMGFLDTRVYRVIDGYILGQVGPTKK